MADMNDAERAVFEQRATVESWDSDYYHPIAERYYDRAIAAMLRLMQVEPGALVLDAGCGPGVHSVRVAKAGFRVCAIDVSQTMLSEAQSRVAAAGVAASVEFSRQDLTRLTFPDAAFHYIFSWGVIIHIHDVEKALDELARILAPGGTLALYVTNQRAWDHKLERLLRYVVRRPLSGRQTVRLGTGTWYDLHEQKLWVWQFDIGELVRQLELRGLRLKHREVGEFSEIQRRVRGPLRALLLRLNNLWFRLRFPSGPAVTNLLVFKKLK